MLKWDRIKDNIPLQYLLSQQQYYQLINSKNIPTRWLKLSTFVALATG